MRGRTETDEAVCKPCWGELLRWNQEELERGDEGFWCLIFVFSYGKLGHAQAWQDPSLQPRGDGELDAVVHHADKYGVLLGGGGGGYDVGRQELDTYRIPKLCF